MDEPRQAVVREWLAKAERDLASALRLLDGEPPFLDTAVYHCQQAAEAAEAVAYAENVLDHVRRVLARRSSAGP